MKRSDIEIMLLQEVTNPCMQRSTPEQLRLFRSGKLNMRAQSAANFTLEDMGRSFRSPVNTA